MDDTLTESFTGLTYQLNYKTPRAWLDVVLANFDDFLLDHALCERKASGMAMSMLAHYPDKPILVKAMTDLALEELHHFKQVMQFILQRKLVLPSDQKDPYIHQLRQHIRKGPQVYFLDRLLTASIIEARGHERFDMIAKALPTGELNTFYHAIARSEARHFEQFLQLALTYFPQAHIENRLSVWLDLEADIVSQLPFRAALH